MKKVTIQKQNIYTCEDFYTPRNQDLEKEMRKLWILGAIIALILGIKWLV